MRNIATLAEMMVQIGADVSGLESGLAQAGDKVKGFGEGMKGVGEGMTKAITLPLVGLGAAALTVAGQHDDVQGRIQAQMGTTAQEAEKLADTATSLWKNAFGEDINEAAEAVTTVGRNMEGLPVDQIESAAEKAFILKDAFGTEIADSTKVANTLMKTFGDDAGKAFDIMTVGMQKGGDYSGELLDTLNEYSPQFKALGYDSEGFLATLLAGVESGAFSMDKLGDTAKESFLLMGEGSDDVKESLTGMGLNADQVISDINSGGEGAQKAFMAVSSAIGSIEDPVARNQAALALFGTPLEDLGPQFQTFFGDVDQSLGNIEGATQTAGDALYDNFGSRLTSVWREAQEALMPLGEILLDMAEAILPPLSAALQTVAQWFQNLSPTMQTIIVVLGIVAAAIGPVLVVVGMLISTLAALAPVAAVLGVSIGALVGIIAGVIAAIVALVVAGVLIYKNWDEIKAKGIEIWGSFKEWLASVWEGIKATASAAWEGIKAALASSWEAIKATASAVWEGIKNYFVNYWSSLKAVFTAAVNLIKQAVSNKWNEIKSLTSAVWNGIKSFFTSLWSGIKSIFTSAVNGVKSFVTNAWNNIKSTTSSVFNSIKSFITSTWNSIKSTIQNTVSAIINTVRSKFNDLKSAVSSAMQAVKDKIKSIWDSVMSFFKGINLASVGRDIIQGLINGIANKATALYNKAKEIASNVVSKFKGIFDINSPSRVFKWMGEMNGKGLEQGMQNSLGRIQKVAAQMAKAAIPPTEKFKGNNPLVKYFNAILEDGDWMNDWITHIPEQSRNMVRDLGKQFSDMTVDDKTRESMTKSQTPVQIPIYLNGSEIAYASVDDMEGLLAQRMYSQNRKGGVK